MPQEEFDPELIKQIFATSPSTTRSQAAKQLALSQMLNQRATSLQNTRGMGNVGGAASAIAQGLQGYMGGKQSLLADQTAKQAGMDEMGMRKGMFEAMMKMRNPAGPRTEQQPPMPVPFEPDPEMN